MSTLRILLVDDETLLRESLADSLNRTDGMEVAGTAGNAAEAIERAQELRPDVIVMDIEMPGRDPFAAAAELKQKYPDAALLFLTAHVHDRFIDRAMDAGAVGFLSKRERPKALVEAIRAAVDGGPVYSADVQERLSSSARATTRGQTLSRREEEVLCYVARGYTKKQIAEDMNLSIKTVEGHTDHLMKKLGIHNKVDLARYAIREGYIKP